MSFNINSLVKHRNELLSRAQEHGADIVLVQETGTTVQQLPGMSSFFKRQGWQMVASSAKSLPQGGKGGIAILAREPLALSPAKEVILDSGQLLFCNLHGASIPLLIASEDLLGNWKAFLLSPSGSTGSVEGILTCPLPKGPFLRAFISSNCVARHQSSTAPIDSLWCSPALSFDGNSDLRVLSDHTGMLSRLHISKSDGPEIFAVASTKNAFTELEYQWQQCAATNEDWQQCLQARDSDRAWQLWSRNAEQTLNNAGALNTQAMLTHVAPPLP